MQWFALCTGGEWGGGFQLETKKLTIDVKVEIHVCV